jgi:hypothetical protein
VRGKSIAIAVAVLAVGAAPAVAKEANALRSVPKRVAPAPQPAAAAPVAQPTTAKPAVWMPTTTRGIKWSGVKYAVWIR